MRRCTWLLLFFAAQVSRAEEPLAPPLVGLLRDSRHAVPIYGVAGAFFRGAPCSEGVLSAAFSGAAGALKTDSFVILLDASGEPVARLAAPAGPALFGFDGAGRPAWVYLASTRELRPLGGPDAAADLSGLEGEVLALGEVGPRVRLLVARQGGLWRVNVSASGEVLSEELLPGLPAAGPALLAGRGAVLAADGSDLIVYQDATGGLRLPLPAPAQDLELLGRGWIRIGQPGGAAPLALRLAEDGPRLYRLPAAAQEVQP
ncbi:MAG TPA: hypothetical protein VFA33_04080 [Bryobacteraceae bacterium]|nr:hypothetical protein [Bryobacteraceae bacterium]